MTRQIDRAKARRMAKEAKYSKEVWDAQKQYLPYEARTRSIYVPHQGIKQTMRYGALHP